MKKDIDELAVLIEFSDTTKDYVDDLTGDYMFFIAGNQYKFRKAKYKLQRRIVNLLSSLDSSDIEAVESVQDYILGLIFLQQGDAWVLLDENAIQQHLDNVEYRPISFFNELFVAVTRRLIPNFTDAGVENLPANSNQESEENLQDTSNQKRSLAT